MVRIFSIAGLSNSGKTTLIEALVPLFKRRGYRIITVKSTKENIYPPKGKDTGRHIEAGANMTVIIGPSSTAIHISEAMTLEVVLSIYDADLVLVEGMKASDIPKLWCVRDASLSLHSLPPNCKGIVNTSETELESDYPHDISIFKSSNVDSIATLIENEAIDLKSLGEE